MGRTKPFFPLKFGFQRRKWRKPHFLHLPSLWDYIIIGFSATVFLVWMQRMNTPIDFDEIRRNAKNEGISLSEITIFYQHLTEAEFTAMDKAGLIAQRHSRDKVAARFAPDGSVMFPEKSVSIFYLAA
jgi:hypothetical protein